MYFFFVFEYKETALKVFCRFHKKKVIRRWLKYVVDNIAGSYSFSPGEQQRSEKISVGSIYIYIFFFSYVSVQLFDIRYCLKNISVGYLYGYVFKNNFLSREKKKGRKKVCVDIFGYSKYSKTYQLDTSSDTQTESIRPMLDKTNSLLKSKLKYPIHIF